MRGTGICWGKLYTAGEMDCSAAKCYSRDRDSYPSPGSHTPRSRERENEDSSDRKRWIERMTIFWTLYIENCLDYYLNIKISNLLRWELLRKRMKWVTRVDVPRRTDPALLGWSPPLYVLWRQTGLHGVVSVIFITPSRMAASTTYPHTLPHPLPQCARHVVWKYESRISKALFCCELVC